MTAAALSLYLAGTGMTAKLLRIEFPSMKVCQQNAERERRAAIRRGKRHDHALSDHRDNDKVGC